jgi:hypothetical protein
MAEAQSVLTTRETLGLGAWDCDLPIAEAEYARMKAHPGLDEALRVLNDASLPALAADRTLLGIFKDGGRYVSAMWAIYLHVCGGLTLQSLKTLCAQSGLLSPGRARAMLLYMRYLGYVEPAREGRGTVRYIPTPRFKTAWTIHMRTVLEAVCVLEPEARAVVDRLDDPDIFAAVVRTQGESLFLGARGHNFDTPLFRVFTNRHAGGLILRELLAGGGDASDGAYPPHMATLAPAADLARRYQVSRIQVRRIVTAAEKEGLIHPGPDALWQLTDGFRAEVRSNHAMQLRHLMLSAARARAALSSPT